MEIETPNRTTTLEPSSYELPTHATEDKELLDVHGNDTFGNKQKQVDYLCDITRDILDA